MTEKEAQAIAVIERFADKAYYKEAVESVRRGLAEELEVTDQGICFRLHGADIWQLCAENEAGIMSLLPLLPAGVANVYVFAQMDDEAMGRVRERIGLAYAQKFDIFAYCGEIPAEDPAYDIRPLGVEALDFVYENYGHASREYLRARLESGVMLGGYIDGQLAAFIGEHDDGSMGLLHVMPEYRRHHLGFAMEAADIRRTMLAGNTPFCQVVPENAASHVLQKRLGMTRADGVMVWLSAKKLS